MFEEKYMRRAIWLAKKGTGAVNPNPLVGAVIVKDGKIIGEGYHARYGELHAERDAFRNLTEDATGAEMYVTLEPCCHYGKQPPCVDAIIEHKIKTVYCGSDDPNSKVAGGGFARLREAGIEVVTHCMKAEADELNDVFFHYIVNKTPYVVMKYAMTLDGKLATYKGESKWISNDASRQLVQESRNKYMGIMAGIGTVLKDDPMLTCRIPGGRSPIRIICDTNLRIPIDSNIVKTACDVPTIVAVSDTALDKAGNDSELGTKLDKLKQCGVDILGVSKKDESIDLSELMRLLGEKGIDSILLEGGGTLNYSALEAGIVNEINAYVAPKIFGGKDSPSPVGGRGVELPDEAFLFKLVSSTVVDGDILLRYKKV